MQPDEPVVAAVDGEEIARLKAELETAHARIGELESTRDGFLAEIAAKDALHAAALAGMNHLALMCGEMLAIGTEAQLNTFAPALASEHLPDTIRALLVEIYGKRATALAEPAPVEEEEIAA